MPTLKMTDAVVKQQSVEPGQRLDFFDAHPRDRQKGLALRISCTEDGSVSKVWAAMFRVAGSKRFRRMTIGDYPTYSLAEAREMASDIVRQARKGIDPILEKRKAKIAAEIAGKDTVDALVKDFMADLATKPKKRGGKRSARYIEETQRNFDNHVVPRWGKRNIRELTRRDVSDLIAAIATEGSDFKRDGEKRHADGGTIAANRTLSAVRAFFNWAIRKGIIEANPATLVEPAGEEIERDRALTDAEIKTICPAAKSLGYPFSQFFQLALILGQRRSEIARMQWQHIDEEAKTWTIPAPLTKGKKHDHVVPLPQLALDLLSEAKKAAKILADSRETETSPFVLSTRANKPISGFSKVKTILDKKTKLEPWHIHDLRRTCATGMPALGVDRFTISRVLNHADSTVTGRHYDKYDYLAEKRDALSKWANHLVFLTRPKLAATQRAAT